MRSSASVLLCLLAATACTTDDDGAPAGDTENATTSSTSPTTSASNTSPTGMSSSGTTDDSESSTTDPTDASGSSDESSGGTTLVFEPDCDADFEIIDPDPNFPWSPLSIRLASEQVAPGVFVTYDERALDLTPSEAPLATSGGFVIGSDGVLLVESMMNQQLTCQMFDLVREQTDLPILYIVNTSYHGDHSYGNGFHGDGTQIVQHTETATFIDEHFEPDRQWMIDNFGANQGIEEVQQRAADILVDNDGWSVDLGGIEVEALHFGFAQTHGDLWVWLPNEQVIWTGNAQVTRDPGLPWLIDGRAEASLATMQTVRDFLPEGATVVPGHDTPQSPAIFDFTINYLQTLLDEVQTSIDNGMTLDETVATVTMDDFRGYVLFDWVHFVMNVPNTYADLTAKGE